MAVLVGSRGLAKTSSVREPLKPKIVSYSGKGEERAEEGQESIAGTRGNMYVQDPKGNGEYSPLGKLQRVQIAKV